MAWPRACATPADGFIGLPYLRGLKPAVRQSVAHCAGLATRYGQPFIDLCDANSPAFAGTADVLNALAFAVVHRAAFERADC